MMNTAAFAAFLQLYELVTYSPALTLAEKTAAIEAAYDEYAGRKQPAAYLAIAQRLAAEPPRKTHAEDAPAQEKPVAANPKAGRPGRVAPRAGR